jgi:hypothetical protein
VTAGASSIGTAANAINVTAANLEATAGSAGTHMDVTGDTIIGGATALITGINSVNGTVNLNGTGNMQVTEDSSAGNGTFNLTLSTAASTLDNDAMISGSTAVNLLAPKMDLTGGTVNAGAGGTVTLNSPIAGDAIDLGSATDAAGSTLELSAAELNTVTANILRIGDTTDAGSITLSAGAISPAMVTALTLRTSSGNDINQTGGTLTIANLKLESGGAGTITLTGMNDVDNLAVSAGTGAVSFTDIDDLTVNTVDGTAGISTMGALTLTAANGITLTAGVSSDGMTTLNADSNNDGTGDLTVAT